MGPRYADAEHYYRRALEGFLRTLGAEHKESCQLRVDVNVNGICKKNCR